MFLYILNIYRQFHVLIFFVFVSILIKYKVWLSTPLIYGNGISLNNWQKCANFSDNPLWVNNNPNAMLCKYFWTEHESGLSKPFALEPNTLRYETKHDCNRKYHKQKFKIHAEINRTFAFSGRNNELHWSVLFKNVLKVRIFYSLFISQP